MSKCLIIGGTGFIGTHLVQNLLKRNRKIRVLSNDSCYVKYPSVEYIEGDYGDIKLINIVLEDCDEVIHLAHNSLKMSFDNSLVSDINENLIPTIQLFSRCQQLEQIKKVLFISSGGTVYGLQNTDLIIEQHATDPISSYGVIKLVIEKYAKLFYFQKNLPVIILRPSNAYGPGQKPFIGQGFIATALASVLKDKPINIFGDGSTVRDYIYIGDLVGGIIAALECGKPGEVYNIGSGKGYSNKQIVEQFIIPTAKNEGFDVELNYLPKRGFDVPSNILSNVKLQKISKWIPQVKLKDGIIQTWNWLKENYEIESNRKARAIK
jgi:UDP-glucose 4-epimerase